MKLVLYSRITPVVFPLLLTNKKKKKVLESVYGREKPNKPVAFYCTTTTMYLPLPLQLNTCKHVYCVKQKLKRLIFS